MASKFFTGCRKGNNPLGLPFGAILIALGMAFGVAGTSRATVIYEDSFTREGSLNGTAPDVANVPGADWIAGDTVTTNGAEAVNPANTTAFLPIAIASGKIYTLKADLNTSSTNDDWQAFGFSVDANSENQWHAAGNAVGPWLLQRGNGGPDADDVFAGPNTSNSLPGSTSGNTDWQTYSIVLDTTAAQWTASWYRDTTQLGTTFTYTTNPTSIAYVGFGNGNVAGLVDNFSLSVVPEPNSMVLALFGVIGVWRMTRRRRS